MSRFFRLLRSPARILVIPAMAAGMLSLPAQSLIPFQGRLTDQQGVPYTNGQFSIFFTIYDQPVGGIPLWQERHEKVGVINGMVNVFLGSISTLSNVSFSVTRHLGITVDADNNPNTVDPEMVPRQMIIPAFWAKQADNSSKLAGYSWSDILVSGDNPTTSLIRGDRLQTNGIGTGQLRDGGVTAAKIAANTITTNQLAQSVLDMMVPPGAVTAYAGTNEPAGWLLCDGRTVSRNGPFSALFAAIGTLHGVGDGASTFNLPDYRWSFLRGSGPNITAQGSGVASNNEATFSAHGFNRSGIKVRLSSGNLAGLSANVDYWVIVISQNSLAFALTKSNSIASSPTKVPISGGNSAVVVQWEDPDSNSRESNARGASSASTIGSYQGDSLRSHSHTITPQRIDGIVRGLVGGAYSIPGGGNVSPNNAWDFSIGNAGGAETRPVNNSVNYIIKY